MGTVLVQEETTKNPLTLIGKEAGICYGTDTIDLNDDLAIRKRIARWLTLTSITSKKYTTEGITDDYIDNYKSNKVIGDLNEGFRDCIDNFFNYRRGVQCIKDGHGRVMELPQVYLTIDGYSARVIREFYTHIAGGPTRLQASTRYINYENFAKDQEFIIPESIKKCKNVVVDDLDDTKGLTSAYDMYINCMKTIAYTMDQLDKVYNIPREDIANILPLGMTTKIIVRTNLRNLSDMSHQRLCTRAYWEFRDLMQNIIDELAKYSDEWNDIVKLTYKDRPVAFCRKCEYLGYCNEGKSCGYYDVLNF